MMWHGDWSGADWALMSLGMLLFWTAVIAGIVWLVRRNTSVPLGRRDRRSLDKATPATRITARVILDQRYARGEIDDAEYRARSDTLSSR